MLLEGIIQLDIAFVTTECLKIRNEFGQADSENLDGGEEMILRTEFRFRYVVSKLKTCMQLSWDWVLLLPQSTKLWPAMKHQW